MSRQGPDRPEVWRRHEFRYLTLDHCFRDLCPDRRRSTTMHASVYESLAMHRLREAHSQAREVRLAAAVRAAKRAARANRVAVRADERAAATAAPWSATVSSRG